MQYRKNYSKNKLIFDNLMAKFVIPSHMELKNRNSQDVIFVANLFLFFFSLISLFWSISNCFVVLFGIAVTAIIAVVDNPTGTQQIFPL